MIHANKPKKIRVMLTTFRDGLQSSFGGKVRLKDILPAMEFSAKKAGIRHFEFGGGARYQAPYFYVGEDPFECQDKMRDVVGPGVDLQILTRSVSGVTLTTQGLPALQLQAKMMHKHGTTWDRNFDFMNDVDNLIATGKPIIESGMHHQLAVALMGLPFHDDTVHTPAFYANVVQKVFESGIKVDSVVMKDASGTTDPNTCYETAKLIRKIIPPEMPLWQHTHDTASMAVSCYMAGIDGGVDGIDLSVRPMASGTVQPDVRSMAHALKGTGFDLDIDVSKMDEIEKMLEDDMSEYEFDPVTTTADARVVGFPMPGGAIGPNVHMMKEAGILDKYSQVLAEFPVVVKAGGAFTSVTPGSQFYWLQAFNNVLHGRWKKMNEGYGKSVLGYFGRPPLPPDPEVVKITSEQLKLEVFTGDPLAAAPDSLGPAKKALEERGLPVTEENIFLVAAAIVPGKNMDLNEGIRLLTGKPKIVIPLKKKAEPAPVVAKAAAPAAAAVAAPAFAGPVTTTCQVEENGVLRSFKITIDVPGAGGKSAGGNGAAIAAAPVATNGGAAPASSGKEVEVYSPFDGKVELVEICVKQGDLVTEGQVVAAVEAMKAKHDVKAPCAGTVISIDADLGADVVAGQPILTIGG
ncbi:MAG: biotin attachment protein [Candidatus Eisenbacteria bacterium]|nr:biotin attachment protein [Candidatus Eisenbacteria bacterium]